MSETMTRKAAVRREALGVEILAEMPEEAAAGGVQSLARAFAILEEVARHREGIGLSDLCRRVGLHSSTTFHLVRTMVGLGYVRQVKESKRYRIGVPVFLLAAQSLDEIEMVNLVTPHLEALSAAADESATFGVRMQDNLAVLARTCGAGPFQAADQVGMQRPLYATAGGKILLAGMGAEQFDLYLRRARLSPLTPRTLAEPQALRAAIIRVRREGVAHEEGEFWPDMHTLAVGVYDFRAQLVGAISLAGPIWRRDEAAVAARIQLLRETAAKVSAGFGYDAADHGGC